MTKTHVYNVSTSKAETSNSGQHLRNFKQDKGKYTRTIVRNLLTVSNVLSYRPNEGLGPEIKFGLGPGLVTPGRPQMFTSSFSGDVSLLR